MINQEHSGSGDNIGGDKNVYVLPPLPPPLTEIPQNVNRYHSGTDTFVGRREDLRKIDEFLHNSGQLAITSAVKSVTGMGGVGKTELALQYALRYQEKYPGGICWVAARSGNIDLQIVDFCQSLGVYIPDDLNPRQKLDFCWSRWIDGNVLIIIDDVQSYGDIKSFLPPKNEKFKVIVTSRQRLGQLEQLRLKLLEPEEALELLKQIIGEERIDQELEKAHELCGWLGYLPLGLELVGRFLKTYDTWSLNKVLERLERKKLTARALLEPQEDEGDMTAQLGIASAFELSWERLSKEAQLLGCYLSLFQSNLFDWGWVESSNLYPHEDEEEQVDELERLRDEELRKFNLLPMIKEEGENKVLFSYHPLLSRYFESKFNQLEEGEDFKRKFCSSMVEVAKSIDDTPTQQEIEKFSIVVPHLEMIATEISECIDDDDLTWPFIGLGKFSEGQTNYQETERHYKKCLLICQQRLGEEHPDVASSINNLANLYYLQGRYTEAEPLYLQAIQICEKILGKDHPWTITAQQNYRKMLEEKDR